MALQKQQLMLQATDIDGALTELEKVTNEKLYKTAGPLMIEANKKDISAELKEKKETSEARIALLEKQEKKLAEKLEELGKELQAMLKGPSVPKAG